MRKTTFQIIKETMLVIVKQLEIAGKQYENLAIRVENIIEEIRVLHEQDERNWQERRDGGDND